MKLIPSVMMALGGLALMASTANAQVPFGPQVPPFNPQVDACQGLTFIYANNRDPGLVPAIMRVAQDVGCQVAPAGAVPIPVPVPMPVPVPVPLAQNLQ